MNLVQKVRQTVTELRASPPPPPAKAAEGWALAQRLLGRLPADQDAVANACASKDLDALDAIVARIESPAPPPTPGVALPEADLERALRAFKKRLKVMRLADESKLQGRRLSSGRESEIDAIVPPPTSPPSGSPSPSGGPQAHRRRVLFVALIPPRDLRREYLGANTLSSRSTGRVVAGHECLHPGVFTPSRDQVLRPVRPPQTPSSALAPNENRGRRPAGFSPGSPIPIENAITDPNRSGARSPALAANTPPFENPATTRSSRSAEIPYRSVAIGSTSSRTHRRCSANRSGSLDSMYSRAL